MLSRADLKQVGERLGALRLLSPGLEAAALVSVEGVTMAASLPDDLPQARVAAMTAAMLALGERIAEELRRGELRQVFIQGEAGYAIVMPVNDVAVLTALVDADAKLGLALLDLRRAVADLRELL